uniref:Uncharacterized protein n=1 Tax=Arundo donax TaxID=35708 RepID=A0A0A9F5N9_ARUDO
MIAAYTLASAGSPRSRAHGGGRQIWASR